MSDAATLPVSLRDGAADSAATTRRAPIALAAGLSLAISICYLLAPRIGIDVSAQLHRADFARHHPLVPVDFSWFGGSLPFGYSLWVPAVMAVIGVPLTAAIANVLCSVLTVRLIDRADPVHPVLTAIAVVVAQGENLMQGRVTFALGAVAGLGALLLLDRSTTSVPRLIPSALLAFLAGSASPVAGLLMILAGLALFLTQRRREGITLATAAGLGVAAVSLLFADTGKQPFGAADMHTAALAAAVTLLAVPRRLKVLRYGAVLCIALILPCYYLPTPVGSNVTRLTLLFALPLTLAFSRWRPPGIVLSLLAILFTYQQISHDTGSIRVLTTNVANRSYYAPLLDAISKRGPVTGRVEIPELVGHWDSYYVAQRYPLARGWLQQTDISLSGKVFYDGQVAPENYRNWLRHNAVQFVAIPDAPLLKHGKSEASLVTSGLSYLNEIWSNQHWRLYEVENATAIVDEPGVVSAQNAATMTIAAPADRDITIRIRWSRWISLSSDDPHACIAVQDGRVVLRTGSTASHYVISSKLWGNRHHC